MKIVLITDDAGLVQTAKAGFHPADEFVVFEDWKDALDQLEGTDLCFVDLLTTLEEPGKIAGYESFAMAKMSHPVASAVPLVVITPPVEYELDFMAGWPNFVIGNIQRPVTEKIFRRASTWV